ncbi:galactosyltransferase-related protein [Comamonas sp.]|uniref:galactosyltransferase-related protein n=1 Tax=Comamonas sp. TaxID=34028 RepID=UPI002FC76988
MSEVTLTENAELQKITLLSLVDFSRRPQQILTRAMNWAEFSVQHQLPLVIGHSHRKSKADQKFLQKIQEYQPLVRVVSVEAESPLPNLAGLRNAGFSLVNTPLLALMDIDIYPDLALVQGLLFLMKRQGARCAMAPCLYLSEKGSKEIRKYADSKVLWKKYLNFHSAQFMHLAMPSSVILLHAEDYSKIGGFDEEYQGHGFEDFDFMVRLWSGSIELSKSDISTNDPYRAPMLGYGFRGRLARLCYQSLINDVIAMHIYHPSEKKEKYYQARINNFDLFKKKVDEFSEVCGTLAFHQIPENLKNFIQCCDENKVNPEKFQKLFDATPAHMRDKYSFHRILKKLKNKFSI